MPVGTFQIGNGARWHQLYYYYNLYKEVSFNGAEPRIAPGPPLINWVEADQRVNFGDEAGGFRFPRFAKVVYISFVFIDRRPPTLATRRRPTRCA